MLYVADVKIYCGKRISSFECSISGTPSFKFKEEFAGVTRNRLAIIAVVSVLAHTPPNSTIYLKINSKHVFEHFSKNPACRCRTNLDMWCVVDKLCLHRQVICESTCKAREELSDRISKIMSFEVPSDTKDEIMSTAEYAYKYKVNIACANGI